MDFNKLKQYMSDKANSVKDHFNEYKENVEQLSSPIEEKDENTYLGTGDNKGLDPKLWTSVAEQKRRQQMINGIAGSVGGIAKTGQSMAQNAAKKLEEAMAKGYKPTAAETMAISKYKNELPVMPSHEDAKKVGQAFQDEEKMREAFLKLKGLLGK